MKKIRCTIELVETGVNRAETYIEISNIDWLKMDDRGRELLALAALSREFVFNFEEV